MNDIVAESADEFPVAWCDADLACSSVLEAVSFVTPALERFLIHVVAEFLRSLPDPVARQNCLEFIREESSHRGMHARLNRRFRSRLGAEPQGLVNAESLLARASKAFSPGTRMVLAAAIEHLTAIFSLHYLHRSDRWTFASLAAKAVFDRHARDEVAHRSVVFDLCGRPGAVARGIAIFAVALGGLLYLVVTAPSIFGSKSGRGRLRSFLAISGLAYRNLGEAWCLAREASLFVRHGFHPKALVAPAVSESLVPGHRGET